MSDIVEVTQADRVRDLAKRIFQYATPAMGFDQGDSDLLYSIANRLAATQQAEVAAGGGWRPIETAPKDGTRIDLWYGGHRYCEYWWTTEFAEDGWQPHWRADFDHFGPEHEPTHWMPLPAAPTDGDPA